MTGNNAKAPRCVVDNYIMEVKAVGEKHGNRHTLLESQTQYNSNDAVITPRIIPQMETITKTAEILNLPVHFVRSAVANGDVVYVRAGRKFLINIDSLITFLNTGIPQGAASAKAAPQTENAPRIAPIPLR